MMKNLDSGTDKVKKICEAIKRETIEPALEEAAQIVSAAREDALKIMEEARRKAENLLQSAREHVTREKHVCEASLHQAGQQALESLRQELEQRFFRPHIKEMVQKASEEPEVIARFIEAVIEGIKKEGIEADFSLIVPQHIGAEKIAACVAGSALKNRLELGPLKGGLQVRFKEDNLTVDISQDALAEFLAEYIRKDLRKILFS